MIPKSGNRFSDKDHAPSEKAGSAARIAVIENFDLQPFTKAAEHAASVAAQGKTP